GTRVMFKRAFGSCEMSMTATVGSSVGSGGTGVGGTGGWGACAGALWCTGTAPGAGRDPVSTGGAGAGATGACGGGVGGALAWSLACGRRGAVTVSALASCRRGSGSLGRTFGTAVATGGAL